MSDDLLDSLKSMSDAELRRLCRSLEREAKRLQAEHERLRKKNARLVRRRDKLREAVARIGGETQASCVTGTACPHPIPLPQAGEGAFPSPACGRRWPRSGRMRGYAAFRFSP